MPPKKKKEPIVVGTVSTRSTRRESIVNIEIIRKSNKLTKIPKKSIKNDTSKAPRKSDITDVKQEEKALMEKPVQSPVEPTMSLTEEPLNSSEHTIQVSEESSHLSGRSLTPQQPAILEILKDWSDDDNSQDDSILFIHSNSSSAARGLTDDQQSLINILEGTCDDSIKKPKSKDLMVDNPIVHIDSPKFSEPEVIEEGVVDENMIIVMPEEQGSNLDETKRYLHLVDNNSSVVSENSSSTYELIIEDVVADKSTSNIIENLKAVSIRDKPKSSGSKKITPNKSIQNNEDWISEKLQARMSKMSIMNEESSAKLKKKKSFAEKSPKPKTPRKTKNKSESTKVDPNQKQKQVVIEKQDKNSPKIDQQYFQTFSSHLQQPNTIDEVVAKPRLSKQDVVTYAKSYDVDPRESEKKTILIQIDYSESSEVKTSEEDSSNSNDVIQSIKTPPKIVTTEDVIVPKSSSKVTPQRDCTSSRLSDIDLTIDEVLRKYTYEEPVSTPKPENSSKSNKVKSSKKKKESLKTQKDEEVRRSDRIKTIGPVKKKSHGLVRSKSDPLLPHDTENSDNSNHDSDKPASSPQLTKPEKSKIKLKSKSSETLSVLHNSPVIETPLELPKLTDIKADKTGQVEIEARLKTFVHLKENQFKTDRQVCKEAKGMVCDCYLAEEDIRNDEYGCGEDCLNRLLMIECGELCQVGERCTNKKFQKSLFAPVEVFKTEKKGLGLRAAANIAYGEFILEYVGEVLNPDEFDKRAEVYSKDKNIHFYFMSLRADAIIDATMKGNISRFINHSCDPNAETQKWTVNGELRIGFFSTRTILAGEEITFDYRFQRYGKEAQKCYCEASSCRGWLGERPADESEEEEEDEEEEPPKLVIEPPKVDVIISPDVPKIIPIDEQLPSEDKLSVEQVAAKVPDLPEGPPVETPQETPKKVTKKKLRKELLYDDFDQLNEDIEMLVTTGLKNQAHTLKLSRLMVRAKDLIQRKKLLRVLRRGELPCRRLFLDYHGLRLMHGYMIEAQQLTSTDTKSITSERDMIQTKLELLQTLAVLPIQNKTMLIESKVLPAVEKWAKNEDIVEDGEQKESLRKDVKNDNVSDPEVVEKIDEIKFLASKLLEEWANLKESFRIPKKERIEQMKEHEKEANRKFMESSYAQEKDSSRKNDQRYRSWSRYKSERESNKKNRYEDKDKPSAEFLKISKHERRKLFALQMELKEEERRHKQREMWRQHEMNCMLIGTDPRFTAPFDPGKGFQYIWNPTLGQWTALPMPAAQNQSIFNSPATSQGVSSFNVSRSTHKQPPMLNTFPPSMVPGTPQFPAGLPPTLPPPPLLPGLTTPSSIAPSLTGISGSMSIPGLSGITQPPLALPMYQEVKEEDPSQVKFAGPIPPPAKLPPKWKCAKDKYGRPYYYHVKIRKSQWEPPPPPPPEPEPSLQSSESSTSESSSGSSCESSSESDSDDDIDDAKLLTEVRRQMEIDTQKSVIPDYIKKEGSDSVTPSPEIKGDSDTEYNPSLAIKTEPLSSIDIRLKEQFNLDAVEPAKKKRRVGLCQEIIISPRTNEDRKQFKEDLKRYRATKEKLKRQKEQMLLQVKKKQKLFAGLEDIKRPREKRTGGGKTRLRDMKEWNDEHAKKIKEVFRSTMATTVVSVLNAYRRSDCKEARITNTEDFKHLARKLTHFVMLKEIKHLSSIDELVCSDNVKAKAREYIRKYMSKFGEVYQKRQDEPDFKD